VAHPPATDPRYLPEVKRQYEAYPFPPRDPEEERDRLVAGTIDHAALVNHYCFRGKNSFDGCRVLAAGGGTGDSTIFWAEQLRAKGGEVVHVDISEASLEIARQRAAVRGLDNIVWKKKSLLEVTPAKLGRFDFINCYGVLHHLEDPVLGLRKLHAVLNDAGAAGLLLYGTYGRLALYQVQELVRRFGIDELDIDQQVPMTRRLMELLPPSSWYKRGPNSKNHENFPDEVFFDSYLHSQDRSYTVSEMYAFIESGEFRFVEFSHATQRMMYRPETFIHDESLLDLLPTDERERQATAELIGGQIGRHEFYISKQPDTIATLDDLDNVPFWFPKSLPELSTLPDSVGQVATVDRGAGVKIRFKLRNHTAAFLKALDGRRSLSEIFAVVRGPSGSQTSDEELLAEFRPLYEVFNRADAMLLRDKGIEPFASGKELQAAEQ
jgi:SAM-dependent methyltransferase